jgi:hypothetical protein
MPIAIVWVVLITHLPGSLVVLGSGIELPEVWPVV